VKAAVLYNPHDLRVETRPDPACGPDDVIIEVTYNGLCGTDATEFAKGPMMVPLTTPHPGSGHVGPTILGHEFIGTVVEAGRDAGPLLGKRVACGAGVACGTCRWCRASRTNLCASYYTIGLSTHGALAEFVSAPARICLPIPDACADIDAALAQPLAVGIHAVRRSGVAPGESVVLLGAGAIGSFICCGLSDHDGPVIAVDIDERRLAVAGKLGAIQTLRIGRDTTTRELAERLSDALPAGPPDLVFETSGTLGSAERAFTLVARGGTVALVGLNPAPQALNFADIVLREINTRTTVAHICDSDLSEALGLLARRRLSEILLGGVVPLDDVVAAGFEPLVAGTATGKILVSPRHG
jgi:(R,R)-butanediol dehydrogenase / meso-butanediol dehydrogenase / diacetyl reductase